MLRDRVPAYRPKSTCSPFLSLSPLRSHLGDPDPAEHLLRFLLGTRLHGAYTCIHAPSEGRCTDRPLWSRDNEISPGLWVTPFLGNQSLELAWERTWSLGFLSLLRPGSLGPRPVLSVSVS